MKHLKVGDQAPAINALNQDGAPITLEEFKGKKVVLFFYPKDNTPGCTAEACNLRDHYSAFQAKGYEIVGVSADSQKKHQNWIEKNSLPFPLIADVERKVIEDYGVWGPKKFMGREFDGIHRTTFIINEEGIIEEIIEKVKTKEHSEQILN